MLIISLKLDNNAEINLGEEFKIKDIILDFFNKDTIEILGKESNYLIKSSTIKEILIRRKK